MTGYTPRPGSKTEIAVNYLRTHGGCATAIDLCEAMDCPRKNLPAMLKAAIDHGLLEPHPLPAGAGYRLVETDGLADKAKIADTPAADAIGAEPRQPHAKREPTPRGRKPLGHQKSVAHSHPSAESPAAADDVDMIDHPPHYTKHPSGIECIQITEHMGFNLGNAIKYLWRADLKGSAIDDLRKAQWYVSRELQKRELAQAGTKAPS
jgi:hypothetical protein